MKTSRVLQDDEQVAKARRLCEQDPHARALEDRILEDARYWVDKSDQELHDLLPDRRVPRAFDVSTEGCPVHGNVIYRHGTYPWKLDREHPFTIICPEGGERYPSNDFNAYYRSGMTDKSLLTGPYADAGRGWTAPNGQKYWLVAYACHWNWMNTWLPAVTTLSRAYVLTGELSYARKAIVMLDRIAEVYPDMEHSTQSRYGELMQGKYLGKIVNAIWETGVLKQLAIAYDQVFPALVGDGAVSLPWRSAEGIRANIEANLLEEGLDGIDKDWISGNYGLHQNALIYTALVRQNGPTRELLRGIFEKTGKGLRHEGLNYALYNLIYKDGMPYESSPNYAAMWLHCLVSMADPLAQSGLDLYAEPKMKRVFDAPLDLICAGKFTPAIGDSGSIHADWIGPGAEVYEAVYRRYRDARYAWALRQVKALDEDRIDTFEDLFEESIIPAARADAARYQPQLRSRLLDGFGVAILNNPTDSMAVSTYYGVRNVHAHRDCLNIELFGHSRRLSPDLGYPDQTDHFHPGIFSWTQNTISHNCLVVDRTAQPSKDAGRVLRFHESPTVHLVDIDAAGTYEQTDVYRRTLVMVDTDERQSYLVDVFRIRGGDDHVLSLHGAEGEFTLAGVDLPPPVTEGTLAGREVTLGQLYDDPVLSRPDYAGSYKAYAGSGYSHLFNWQRVRPDGPVIAQWVLRGEGPAALRVHLPPSPGQEITVADAFVSPTKKIPAVLKYVLVRRQGGPRGNTFVAVWEPVGATPQVERVEMTEEPHTGGCESIVTLTVYRGTKTDVVSVAPKAGLMHAAGSTIRTDAAVCVSTSEHVGEMAIPNRARQEAEGGRPRLEDRAPLPHGHGSDKPAAPDTRPDQETWTRVFAAGGTSLTRADGETIRVPPTLSGTVREVDYVAGRVVVETDTTCPDLDMRQERPTRFFNPRHSSIHRVTGRRTADTRLTLEVRDGEMLTGRLRVSSYDAGARLLGTSSFSPHAANLIGMHVIDGQMKHVAAIASAGKGTFELEDRREAPLFADRMHQAVGQDVWVADFAPGDKIEIEGLLHVTPAP
ncbi:MAG: heparinase II/III family protein [Planctomycetes bacterium]|nr:heparinase II/III family protein [Planctomycetota bacterium]